MSPVSNIRGLGRDYLGHSLIIREPLEKLMSRSFLPPAVFPPAVNRSASLHPTLFLAKLHFTKVEMRGGGVVAYGETSNSAQALCPMLCSGVIPSSAKGNHMFLGREHRHPCKAYAPVS